MLANMKTLLAATALTVLAGPAFAVNGVTDKEILIGTHLDLSGPVAAAMPQLRNAMQMRIDEANEAGGVNGRKLEVPDRKRLDLDHGEVIKAILA